MTADTQGLDDRIAITDLLAAYALTLDADDIDACLGLFSADGEFVVFGKTLSGPDGIRRMLTRAPRGLHLTGATLIDIGDRTATARTQVLFMDTSTGDLRPALYDDELVKLDGRWRFRRRRCRFITADGLADSPQQAAQ